MSHPAYERPRHGRPGAPGTANGLVEDRKTDRIEATEIKSFPVG
jgi:hypothetical protein